VLIDVDAKIAVLNDYKLLSANRLDCRGRLDLNRHTYPILTEKPVGIPTPTESRNPPYPYPTPCVFLLDFLNKHIFMLYT